MEYSKTVILKNGEKCVLRSCGADDARAVLDVFILTHRQTDFLLSYPDEITFTVEEEADFLRKKADSEGEIEIAAFLGGKIAGTAGIEQKGGQFKLRHRAEMGISVDSACWGLGIGGELMKACIECAKKAGYEQLELEVAGDNDKAISLYRKYGFTEYGRNPKGFRCREGGYKELVYMLLELG